MALEALGVEMHRFSIRAPRAGLVDPEDRREAAKVKVLLPAWPWEFAWDVLATCAGRPRRFWRAFRQTVDFARQYRGRYIAHAAYLMEACRLQRCLQARSIDVLHAHFGTNPAAVAALTRILGGPPFVFTVHGPEEFEDSGRLSLAAKANRAAAVVCVSRDGAAKMRELCRPQDGDRVVVVRCGLDDQGLRRPMIPVPAAPILTCVARLCRPKDHRLLLEAARILEMRGVEISLVLVGDGPLREDLERNVREMNLAARVAILGWQPEREVAERMAAGRAVVLASRAEGLPLVLMEALAAYRPVIATDVGGVSELVDEGNGWLVPPGDAEALAAAIEIALRADSRTLLEMGRRGHDRVAAEFTTERSALRLCEIYGAALAGQDPPGSRTVRP